MRNMMVLAEMWHGRELGDPFLLRHDGRYYLYGSSFGEGIKCWISEDMASFSYYGMVCMDIRVKGAYAPEVCFHNGWFYMVTSPVGSGHYLLRSRDPLGPFEIISENLGLLIDGSLFVDDDGEGYFLRAGHHGIEIHTMPCPGQIDANGKVLPATYMRHWTEGPMIIKRDERYYLSFTGNHVISRGYRVDYCVTDQNPMEGWHRLRHHTLLLETEDPFYALGHSSSCLAPDMDSYYIVYHNNEFDEKGRPLGRRLNLDRLFFNGDRMYVNATYWDQHEPRKPLFSGRGEGALNKVAGGYQMPVSAPEVFTAEWNGIIADEAAFEFAGHTLTLTARGDWRLGDLSGSCPKYIDWSCPVCVHLSKDPGGLLRVWVNRMQLVRTPGEGHGAIAVRGLSHLGYAALSDVAGGSGDQLAPQAVPGMFDAAHSADAARFQHLETEKNCMGVRLKKGESLSYTVNAREAGEYHLALRTMDDGVLTWHDAGVVTLLAGHGPLKITAGWDMLVDRVQLVGNVKATPQCAVCDGREVQGVKLNIIGHKFAKSMIHKYSGFTCAENHGQAYLGNVGWKDYAVSAVLYADPHTRNGEASIFLRVKNESWYGPQVEHARQGYRVRICPNRIELCKDDYDEQTLASAMLIRRGMELAIKCVCQGNTICVYHGEALALSFTDPDAYLYGKVGMECLGEGVGFTDFLVEDC